MNKINKSKHECPVTEVTVYRDLAQVSRVLEMTIPAGNHELHVTDFVDIQEDSIRVEGRGNATIAEVSFQSEWTDKDVGSQGEKERELQNQLERLQESMDEQGVKRQQEVVKQQKNLLEAFFMRAAKTGVDKTKEEDSQVPLTDDYIKGVKYYIEEYKQMNYSLSTELHNLAKKEENYTKEIEVVLKKLQDLYQRQGHGGEKKKECVVVLEVPEETKIHLNISYIVSAASWVPFYDLRMFTDQGKLKICYYGMITQSSGEDWSDAKIFLSTAEPSCGGTIPHIPLTTLSIQPQRRIMPIPSYSAPCHSMGRVDVSFVEDDADEMMDSIAEPLRNVEVKVIDKTTSTSYEIARLSTIPSDSNPHKVTVAMVDFEPDLSYVTIPKASPNAFLRAKVVNSSPYMLLSGESNIFLDNSFITKADLDSVAPNEEFTCSLGVDPGVRVTYKPVMKMKSTAGLLYKVEKDKYDQVIEVKNLHSYTIKIVVQDSFPKSSAEKIKVALLSPNIDPKHPEKSKSVRITKENVVEWKLSIPSMETARKTLSWTVENSSGERVKTDTTHIASSSIDE